ncbi:MAG TPA: TIGR04282 family arsenosugar biosynthesis glycosyltransferase [Candidatus Kapabacteria bacterium]|nr:TIGR04282 family arsenosugar biosynthesis glycosyltransferase [Candidatus Kapabacteria bacterium]
MNAEGFSPGDTVLLIFARYPTPGKVKTRLAATLGADRAATFYRACAEYIFQECAKLDESVTRYLFYSDDADNERMRQWVGNDFLYMAQGTGDLGERMSNAFEKIFSEGAHKVIIIGTDVPDISAGIIGEAIRALDDCDAVIGPSRDGGYYLLGMKQLHEEIFSNITWGSGSVFAETVKRLQGKRLSLHSMLALADIDTEDDLRTWYVSGSQDHPLKDVVKNLIAHV